MTPRERIARALMEAQFQTAAQRRGHAAPPQDRQQPEDWKFRARPQGSLKNGLTGVRIEAKKRF